MTAPHEPYPGAAGPDSTPPAHPTPPVDVVTAFQLLCAVAALGVVTLAAMLLAVHGDLDVHVAQLQRDVAAQDPTMVVGADAARTMLTIGLGLTGLLGLGVTALFLLVVVKMRAGRNWARMLVTMVGVMTVFSAVPALFGLGAGTGAAAVVGGGAGILQAVLAVGAIVLMHRAEANRYFLPRLR